MPDSFDDLVASTARWLLARDDVQRAIAETIHVGSPIGDAINIHFRSRPVLADDISGLTDEIDARFELLLGKLAITRKD